MTEKMSDLTQATSSERHRPSMPIYHASLIATVRVENIRSPQSFHVHQELLAANSDYIQTLLQESPPFDGPKVFKLCRTSPEAFALFARYIYLNSDFDREDIDLKCQAYLLGVEFVARSFKECMLDAIKSHLAHIAMGTYEVLALVRTVYARTSREDELRQVLADYFTAMSALEDEDDGSDTTYDPGEGPAFESGGDHPFSPQPLPATPASGFPHLNPLSPRPGSARPTFGLQAPEPQASSTLWGFPASRVWEPQAHMGPHRSPTSPQCTSQDLLSSPEYTPAHPTRVSQDLRTSPQYYPSSPSWALENVTYIPDSPVYRPADPQLDTYSSNSPEYTPAHPAWVSQDLRMSPQYCPSSPSWAPENATYIPDSPVYKPASPQLDTYMPNGPMYTPASPPFDAGGQTLTAGSSLYAPVSPIWASESTSLAPCSSKLLPTSPGYGLPSAFFESIAATPQWSGTISRYAVSSPIDRVGFTPSNSQYALESPPLYATARPQYYEPSNLQQHQPSAPMINPFSTFLTPANGAAYGNLGVDAERDAQRSRIDLDKVFCHLRG